MDEIKCSIQTMKVSEPAVPWDDKKVKISWCEDGQYFAVSSIDPTTGKLPYCSILFSFT